MLHQEAGAAREADVDLRHDEVGVVRRDHDVAGEHQHEARAERRAVDGAITGLAQSEIA